MKRLALLTMTAFLAVVLSACGESEKKDETNVTVQPTVQPGTDNTTAPSDASKTGQ